jgi:WD40 repeat protein
MKFAFLTLMAVVILLSSPTFSVAQTTATLKGHKNTITCLAFVPDGRTLLSGAKDGTVLVWDLAARKVRATLPGHKDMVTAVAVSPDGQTLATGGIDRNVTLWDVAAVLKKHPTRSGPDQ